MNASNLLVWISLTDMSERLRNTLQLYNSIHRKHNLFDIDKDGFMGIKGVGEKQWKEFERLRKEYINAN